MADDTWTVGRVLRWFTLGSGQLKRRSDRLQVLARVLLVCALTMSLPIALAVGSAVHAAARSQAAAESAARHQQDARLLEDVVTSAETGNGGATVEVEAVWTGPSGERMEGLVPVAGAKKAGSLVPVWLDRNGHRTRQPLSDADVQLRSVGWTVLSLIGLCVLALAAYTSVRIGLDRSRSRRWATEWAAVEPRWNRQVS